MNLAESLNLSCLCDTLRPELLDARISQGRPHLLSATPVFISRADGAALQAAVAALHRVAALPGFQAAALARWDDPPPAFGPLGAFMGYDFHMGAQGPRLIEINTNAGGAFVHAAGARAHRACCELMGRAFDTPVPLEQLDAQFMAMFRAEWQSQRGDAPLHSIAIVDDDPAQQYLAPEFELARALFEREGLAAVVADAAALQWRDGRLWHGALAIDLVYNRLTDFHLTEPRHAALRQAWRAGATVLTPHPHAHAVHADKRNLALLCDDALLAAWGASAADRKVLAAVVPHTEEVTAANLDALWARRRGLFFKPAGGFGSRAAWRGDKLTRRVWDEIAAGGYVAQDYVPPSRRRVDVGGVPTELKLDLRAYAYAGRVLLLAARTWAGQATNFRTEGGGFSPVAVLASPETPVGENP